MPSPACIACASDAAFLPAGRVVAREGTFDLRRCPRCGLLGLDPPPTAEVLDAAYGEGYYGPEHVRFAPGLEPAVVALSARRARGIARFARPPARVLDVGCGRGEVLRALVRLVPEAFGTERDERSARAARASSGAAVHVGDLADARYADAFFDVATAWHVLEHLGDPAGAVAELARVIRPGGALLVECPNVDSLQARLGGEKWFHLDVPRHQFDFGTRSLSLLLERFGFGIEKTETFSLLQGPFGLYQTLLNRLGLRRDAFYEGLRRVPSTLREAPGAIGISSLLSPLGFPLSFLVEMAAAAAGAGGVVRIVARRPPAASILEQD